MASPRKYKCERVRRKCRGCDNDARAGDPFCCNSCREVYYRGDLTIGERETVQMQGDSDKYWLNGGTQRANLQNSA